MSAFIMMSQELGLDQAQRSDFKSTASRFGFKGQVKEVPSKELAMHFARKLGTDGILTSVILRELCGELGLPPKQFIKLIGAYNYYKDETLLDDFQEPLQASKPDSPVAEKVINEKWYQGNKSQINDKMDDEETSQRTLESNDTSFESDTDSFAEVSPESELPINEPFFLKEVSKGPHLFEYHAIGSTNRGLPFNARVYCAFTDCPMKLELKMLNEESLLCKLEFLSEKCVHKVKEMKGRQLRGKERIKLSKELIGRSPETFILHCGDPISKEARESGNRDGRPSGNVLSRIKHDAKAMKRPHQKLGEILRLLGKIQVKEIYDVKALTSTSPISAAMWSLASITDDSEMARRYCVHRCDRWNYQIWWTYEVVVRNTKKRKPSLVAATWVTEAQTEVSIQDKDLEFLKLIRCLWTRVSNDLLQYSRGNPFQESCGTT